MKEYRIKVITEQKHEGVTLAKDGRLIVAVNAKREQGAANVRALALLALFLGIPQKDISLVRGHTQATKTVRIHTIT